MSPDKEVTGGGVALAVSLAILLVAFISVLRALALQLLWNSGVAHLASVEHLAFGPALAIGLATLILLPSPIQRIDTGKEG